MEKYARHFMEIAFNKLEFDEFFFEDIEVAERDDEYLNKYFFDEKTIRLIIEEMYANKRYVVRYPDLIEDGRPLAKIRFYDISYIVDGDLVYESQKHNYSNWICFGQRIDADLLEEESCCCNGYGSYIMKNGDMTYQEYMDNYLGHIAKKQKTFKNRWQVYRNHL